MTDYLSTCFGALVSIQTPTTKGSAHVACELFVAMAIRQKQRRIIRIYTLVYILYHSDIHKTAITAFSLFFFFAFSALTLCRRFVIRERVVMHWPQPPFFKS